MIPFGPQVQRLTTNDEGFIAELQNSSEIINDLRVENAIVQAKLS